MLILTRKSISKTRSFLSQSLSSLAAPTAQSHCLSLLDTARSSPFPPDSKLESRRIVHPFKAWFQTSRSPFLDRIYQILTSRNEEDLSSINHADSELTQLGFRLSEAFVLEVLRYGSDVLACLKFFDWAGRQPGFHHTRATFHAIFKILSRARLMNVMLDFLSAFNSQRNVYKSRFYDTLVIGYAVAGKPELALEMLGRMRYQGLDLDSLSYNVLLNSLVEGGFFSIVDVVLDQMRMRGHVNEITDSIVMRSLCKQDRVDEAEGYLRRLVSEEQRIDGGCLRVLVDALCKQERFEDVARLVFEFKELGCVTMKQAYDAWIRGLVQAGKPDVAMSFLEELKAQDEYIPDVFRYNMLIFRLLKEGRLNEVFDLLTEMREEQVVPDKATMNAVMCFFCKAGMVEVALELFHLRDEFGLTPSSMVYNYLVNSLCGYGNVDEAFQVMKIAVEDEKFRGSKTFWILADGLCRDGKIDKMYQLLALALQKKFKPNDYLYNRLISALCRAKRVDQGYILHKELTDLTGGVTTETTYRHMISEFNKLNRGDIASSLLAEMQEKGHEPARPLVRAVVQSLFHMENPEQRFFKLLEMQLNTARDKLGCYTYNLFIDAAGHAGRPDLATKVFEVMIDNGISPNLDSDILMLQSHLKSDRIADAFSHFQQIRARRELKRKPYHAMVVGLCKAKKINLALEIMEEIKENGLIPSLTCYEELMLSLCNERQYDRAVQLFNEMEKMGRCLSSFIGNIFLLHSFKSRDLYHAWIRWRDFSRESPSNVMLGELIVTFSCDYIPGMKAEDLLQAIRQCFVPDVFTYNLLLRKLSRDQIDEALQLFNKMCRKGYEPNRWTYDALVHGLFVNGRRADAMRLLDEMFRLGFNATPSTVSLF